MTAAGTITTLRRFWLKHYDAMEVLIMDQGSEFGADFSTAVPIQRYCARGDRLGSTLLRIQLFE